MDIGKIIKRIAEGESIDNIVEEAKEEFLNYAHLLTTLTDEQIGSEIGKRFGHDHYESAIILFLYAKIREIENGHK